MSNKKKKITATAAVITAAALLLGGTFAWQSISQTALNEKDAVINPGGRLHDDFDGSNKDIYVENFADEPIFVRVRLDEYFEFITNKGTEVEQTHIVTTGATKGDTDSYLTHRFDSENLTDEYWNWTTGGSTTYMPTFNKNKDSLQADINGTYENEYNDYVYYTQTTEVTDYAVYDNDANSEEDDNTIEVQESHYAATSETGSLISMVEWHNLNDNGEAIGNYWVYDTDGWVYWSSPIASNTATGLLLDAIAPVEKFDDSYYYAINVVAQFITADDAGQDNGTGFYDTNTGTAPSENAEALLRAIGVDLGVPTGDTVYSVYVTNDDGYYDLIMFSSADTITIQDVVTITGVDINSVEGCYKNTDANHNKLVSSVSFINEVAPTDMTVLFANLGIDTDSGTTIDFTNFDTSKTTDMSYAFLNCNITSLDLSSFDTSNVTAMGSLFAECSNLEAITFGENWDTSNVSDISSMFESCDSLTELDLSVFNTTNVTDMFTVFRYCNNLKTVNLGENWNTSSVRDMFGMFYGCSNLETITSAENMNTYNVEDMSYMFEGCSKLTLNCSAWDVTNVADYYNFATNAPNVVAPNFS